MDHTFTLFLDPSLSELMRVAISDMKFDGSPLDVVTKAMEDVRSLRLLVGILEGCSPNRLEESSSSPTVRDILELLDWLDVVRKKHLVLRGENITHDPLPSHLYLILHLYLSKTGHILCIQPPTSSAILQP